MFLPSLFDDTATCCSGSEPTSLTAPERLVPRRDALGLPVSEELIEREAELAILRQLVGQVHAGIGAARLDRGVGRHRQDQPHHRGS